MSYEKRADYQKQWLFPPSLEDWVPEDHPARMVREFVDSQDLGELGFRPRKSEDGRPNYSADLLLKVWLYGYMTRIRSSRGLERACMDQIGMVWLAGMHQPDHTTLWRFWRDNRPGIRRLFGQLLKVAVSLELVGMVLHAVDGTKVVSQASERRGWHRAKLEKKLASLEAAIREIMKETEQAETREQGESRLPEKLRDKEQLREQIREQLKRLDAEERDHLNPQDPDARVMPGKGGRRFAYNAQAVADAGSRLIVAADVVNEANDQRQLVPMLEQVEQNLGGVARETVADNGYATITALGAAGRKQYPVLVDLSEPAAGERPYHISQFAYDPATDCCVCPRGETLTLDGFKRRPEVENPYTVRVYRCQSYESCPVRWQCSSNKAGRTVHIHPDYAALERQRLKQARPGKREALKKRGSIIEPVFGWSKEILGLRRWTVRGLEQTRTQWLLMCTAINLRRLHRSWVSGGLVFSR